MYSHYLSLIIYSQNKANREYKLQSHSDSNLRFKKSCGHSSIKTFVNKGLQGDKDNLTMNTTEKHDVVRSFSSSLIVSFKFFLLKDLKC